MEKGAVSADREELARALFAPRAIALVGASGDPSRATARPLRFLRDWGFPGTVYPINPGRDEVLGERTWPDLKSLPGPVDHAFIMVPAKAVEGVIAACGAACVPLATVYSDGFSDAGASGLARQEALMVMARRYGVRIIGPNSMGLINVNGRMPLTVNAVLDKVKPLAGRVSLVSQSGTMLGSLMTRGKARGLGFAKLVSVGNEADLGVGELVDLLVDDVDTDVILLFLETLRNADRLGRSARRAFAAGKPVIAYRLGRSAAGRALAATHTGAIAGPDKVIDAFLRHHGIIRVGMLDALVEAPVLVRGQRPGIGQRVAVMTTTGGGAAMIVDRLGDLGAELVAPPAGLIDKVAGRGIHIGGGPLIDLTVAGARPDIYGMALDSLVAETDADAVVAVVGSSGVDADRALKPFMELVARGPVRRPVAVFIAPQADESLARLSQAGIACFRTPEACADAVAAYLAWRAPNEAAGPVGNMAMARVLLTESNGPVLDEAASGAVFEALGVPRPKTVIAETSKDACNLVFPVVAKVLSPDIQHKTEFGAVILGIADPAALSDAISTLRARIVESIPMALIKGILVQEMVQGLGEVIVGFRRDQEVGPIIAVGVGGRLAELHDDAAVRMAPVDMETARKMIEVVPGLAALRGYRGMEEGDVEALARAIAAVSDLARIDGPRVLEAEVNPLIVGAKGKGVFAADGVVLVEISDA
jgi:acyl-CoA synthetase (NDP forming)